MYTHPRIERAEEDANLALLLGFEGICVEQGADHGAKGFPGRHVLARARLEGMHGVRGGAHSFLYLLVDAACSHVNHWENSEALPFQGIHTPHIQQEADD